MKITPAHDPNDFMTGKRHNLEFINIFDDNGKRCLDVQFPSNPHIPVRQLRCCLQTGSPAG